MTLDNYHRTIIHFLGQVGHANTNRIAENTHISWATANTKLKHLQGWGYVVKVGTRSRAGYVWALRTF